MRVQARTWRWAATTGDLALRSAAVQDRVARCSRGTAATGRQLALASSFTSMAALQSIAIQRSAQVGRCTRRASERLLALVMAARQGGVKRRYKRMLSRIGSRSVVLA